VFKRTSEDSRTRPTLHTATHSAWSAFLQANLPTYISFHPLHRERRKWATPQMRGEGGCVDTPPFVRATKFFYAIKSRLDLVSLTPLS